MQEPNIQVGILSEPRMAFRLTGAFTERETNQVLEGEFTVSITDDIIELIGEDLQLQGREFFLEPRDASVSHFELEDVTIGIDFHWERKENLRYRGGLKIIREGEKFWAINELPLEDYLKSVISSEMRATSSLELLKAHAIISRSWLLAQIQGGVEKGTSREMVDTDTERIRWYDREDHTLFDVCADDHCQRYQGITRTTTDVAHRAVEETRGMILAHDGRICDARYSKSCGGVSERFEYVWEPEEHAYLQKVVDAACDPEGYDLNLSQEDAAENWIRTAPPAFCNTHDKEVLSQVLNEYDQETSDFYRWKVSYTQQELAELIRKRSGFDFGEIIDLIPMERGVSGRLIRLMIVGTERVFTVGKELEIRKWLSESHLYSSAFVVDKYDEEDGIPQRFELIGAGWGHGVGLCQIGAAVMGAQGYTFDQILMHYFRGAELETRYQ